MATEIQIKEFEENGYMVLENFATPAELKDMHATLHNLVEDMNPSELHTVFSTEKHNYRDTYFADSASNISYFFEDKARDDKEKLLVDKQKCLNKIGHGLHFLTKAFRNFTFGEKTQLLVKSLGYVEPVVVQSMAIFKQPFIGGSVHCHQDASYLYSSPAHSMGLWLALEDCTMENSCLAFIPGSHKDGIAGGYRMIQNPDKQSSDSCVFIGTKPQHDESKLVYIPVKAGTLIAIDGHVVHHSNENTSSRSRNIYTFHLYESHNAEWSDKNWIQNNPKVDNFKKMYEFHPEP